jgi:hypothetical protein
MLVQLIISKLKGARFLWRKLALAESKPVLSGGVDITRDFAHMFVCGKSSGDKSLNGVRL